MEFYIEHLNWTALICASRYGYIEIVQELLSQKDININIQDIWIQKFLHSSAYHFTYGIEKSKLLWSLHLKFNVTALTMAVLKEKTEIVRLLLAQNDIDTNRKDIYIHKHSLYLNRSFF